MNVSNADHAEGFIAAKDGVQLYYRDYGQPSARTAPLFCLSGLTRNSADFHPLARRLASRRRVVAMDYRGRGRSGYDPNPQNYNPLVYVNDALTLMDHLALPRVVVFGTSLGGICAMSLAAMVPERLAGVVLNDVGPTISEVGRARIGSYVGADIRFPSIEAAATAMEVQFRHAYPDMPPGFWRQNAEDSFVFDPAAGNYRPNYDLALAIPLRAQAALEAPDLWPLFAALKPIPTLAVRGALSDLLDVETFDRMAAEKPDLRRVVVPNRGHVPLPHEEPLVSALEDFLESL
ncbi:MAG: alpha/beta hydrolase [Alphaproteobacteria bacterium]|nr:alpha/beta hydrolase [Alphaproteobacteria bacterium]